MENYQLGRQVLDVADFDEARFDMRTWGQLGSCGTTACLAGHAMLLSGYTLARQDCYYRPDGSLVGDLLTEAVRLLGMSENESVYGSRANGPLSLFLDMTRGLERFRELVEAAEKEHGGR